MVAEKPSLAESISFHLSDGRAHKRPRAVPVFEYDGMFQGQPAFIKVTSTTGHVFGLDFTAAHQNWEKVDEDDLFTAPTAKKENGGPKIVHHLANEAEGCDTLVLWLDCDREGENICFEVMHIVRKSIHRAENIFRAKFSAITKEELSDAYRNLGRPNKDIAKQACCTRASMYGCLQVMVAVKSRDATPPQEGRNRIRPSFLRMTRLLFDSGSKI
jgi:DNA topoisomerase III